MAFVVSGDPYWKANTPTWKRVKTFYWPGAKTTGQCQVIVSHDEEVKAGSSKLRIINGDATLAEFEWNNGKHNELHSFVVEGDLKPGIWEIHLCTCCDHAIGQVHSISITPAEKLKPHNPLLRPLNNKCRVNNSLAHGCAPAPKFKWK